MTMQNMLKMTVCLFFGDVECDHLMQLSEMLTKKRLCNTSSIWIVGNALFSWIAENKDGLSMQCVSLLTENSQQ